MFNFLHKLASNFYFTKPSVNYFQTKSINLYFKADINKKYVWLNLEKYQWVSPTVEQLKDENTNFFILKLNTEDSEGKKSCMDLAKFETRKEADEALIILTNKLFSPEKSIIKFTVVAFLLVMLWGVLFDMTSVLGKRMFAPSSQQTSMVQTVPSQMVPSNIPALTPEQQTKMLEELQKQGTGLPAAPPVQTAPVQIENPVNPAVKNIIDGLGIK